MGEARARRSRTERFLSQHPYCCFCGGTVPATTVEHAPPIVFFVNRQRPATHEFPACERCNLGSKANDMVAAFTAVSMATATHSVEKDYADKIISGLVNNYPEVASSLKEEGSTFVRKNGILHPAVAIRTSAPLYVKWLNPWAAKQGLALWYLYAGGALAEEGRVSVRWFSNHDLWDGNVSPNVWNDLPDAGYLSAGKRNSIGTYEYKFGIDEEKRAGIFLLLLYGCALVAVAIDSNGSHEVGGDEWPTYFTGPGTGIVEFAA